MPRYAYVNGRYVPHNQAQVSVEDRGYQFADGVYEVVAVVNGRYADLDRHFTRLDRSLRELRIPWPVACPVLRMIVDELVYRNGVNNGTVYIQITRGVAKRDFRFPDNVKPALVVTARSQSRFATPQQLAEGVAVITIPDIRWLRRDIKSVSLLPQVLGKQCAAEVGAFEAWQVDAQGFVTEGCSSNAWIITENGVLVTRLADNSILNGCTRLSLLEHAATMGIACEVRSFTVDEALHAREAFLTSATTFVMPVTRINTTPVSGGRPGPITMGLRDAYLNALQDKTP